MSKAPRSSAKSAPVAKADAVAPTDVTPSEIKAEPAEATAVEAAPPAAAAAIPEPAPVVEPQPAAATNPERPLPKPVAPIATPTRNFVSRYGAQAAVVAVALGLGYGFARAVPHANQAQLVEATAGVRETRQTLARLTDDMQVLKGSLDGVKEGLERPRDTAKLTQSIDRLAKDSADKNARLAEQVDRIERAQRDPARLAALTERLDRMEKQIVAAAPKPVVAPVAAATPAPAVVPSPKGGVSVTGPDGVASTGSIAKPERVPGWVLREAGEGGALVESQAGQYREIYPGQSLPGGVRILSVEKRGRQWVVVTSKGLITPN